MRPDLHDANRWSWNEATKAHNRHKGDQAAFFRNGGSTLHPEERDLLGDIAGKTLVHLQCNAGQDTLSLARLGAVATGVDISDEAITFATRLSQDSGIPATFIRSELFDWLDLAGRDGGPRFDVAFASYGALCWLSDLRPWAGGIARILKPGGALVVMEFHPVMQMLEVDYSLRYPYSSPAPLSWDDGVGDYVALSHEGLTLDGSAAVEQPFVNPHPCHEWHHGIADVLTPVLEAGLVLERFREWPYSNGFKPFTDMRALPGRKWTVPEGMPAVPLMFGLRARKP
ncbi:MAG TPA: class I SAM-dependent methyltransferase [bacterium]|nr:class I SAM-dependent methyltransferase [bacterium]